MIIVPLTNSHRLLSRLLVTHHYMFILSCVLQYFGDTDKFQNSWNNFNAWWQSIKKTPKVFPAMLTFTGNAYFTGSNLTKEFGAGLIHSWFGCFDAFSTCSLLRHSAILLLSTSLSNNTPKVSLHYFWSSKLSTPAMQQRAPMKYWLPTAIFCFIPCLQERRCKKDYRDKRYSHHLSLEIAHFVAFLPQYTMWIFKKQSFEQLSLGNHSIACNTSLTEN